MLGHKVLAGLLVACSGVFAEVTDKDIFQYPDGLTAAERAGNDEQGALEARGFPGCKTCRQVWCNVNACYHPEHGPGQVVVAAIGQLASSTRDGGTLVTWNDSGSNCANGLRKGNGLLKLWRVPCDYRAGRYNVHYDGPQGTFAADCSDHLEIKVSKC